MDWIFIFLLTATAVSAIVVYFLFRRAMRRMKGGALWALLPVAVLAPALFFAIWGSASRLWQWHPKLGFKEIRWLAKPEKRYRVTDNIIESGMLIGKTSYEVEHILSPDWFYPEDQTSVGDIFRTDTTRMVYSIGNHPTALSPTARREPNSLEILLENGVVARVSEVFTDIPDGPLVRMSGFEVDPSLDTVTFTERDRVPEKRGTSGGYARMTRAFVRDGVRDYVAWHPERPKGVSRREWNERLATMRDSLRIVEQRFESDGNYHYFGTNDTIPWIVDSDLYYAKSLFSFGSGLEGFNVSIEIDSIPPLFGRGRPTVVVEGEVVNFSFHYGGPPRERPDSVYLAFNRVPSSGRLTGRVYAVTKDIYWKSRHQSWYENVDMEYEGVFMLYLPVNNENQ